MGLFLQGQLQTQRDSDFPQTSGILTDNARSKHEETIDGNAAGVQKDFAVKGNVIDLAVGVIIGGAFGKIVDSVVADLIMPVVGNGIWKAGFSSYFVALAGNVPPGTAMTLDALRKNRCTGICLRQLHYRRGELHNSCVHHFRDGQANQPSQA